MRSPLHEKVSHGRGLLAISPIIVFLVFYLVVSIVMGDFYKMPIAVALVIASMWAVAMFRGKSLAQRIEIFSKEAGGSNVLYMVWIFVLAGAFAMLAEKIGAVEATVNLTLKYLPPIVLELSRTLPSGSSSHFASSPLIAAKASGPPKASHVPPKSSLYMTRLPYGRAHSAAYIR